MNGFQTVTSMIGLKYTHLPIDKQIALKTNDDTQHAVTPAVSLSNIALQTENSGVINTKGSSLVLTGNCNMLQH